MFDDLKKLFLLSQVYFFEGNYSDYEENKKKRLGYIEPKRIRYKKLIK